MRNDYDVIERSTLSVDTQTGNHDAAAGGVTGKQCRINPVDIVICSKQDRSVLQGKACSLAVSGRTDSVISIIVPYFRCTRVIGRKSRLCRDPYHTFRVFDCGMYDIARKALFCADDFEARLVVLEIESVESSSEGAEPSVVLAVCENVDYVIVAEGVPVTGNLLYQLEFREFGVVIRSKDYKTSDSRDKHLAVWHAVQISDSVADFLRIVREIVPYRDELVSVRIRKHRESPTICSDPYAAVLVLLYGIYIVGTQGIRIMGIPCETSRHIVLAVRLHANEAVTLGAEPYVASVIFEYRIYDTDITCLRIRESPA